MPPTDEHLQPFLRSSEYLTDIPLQNFLDACKNNDLALATSLLNGRDADALTWGLNEAIAEKHLHLARELIMLGATWDSRSVYLASESFEAVRMLIDCGIDVNMGLSEGGVLLPLVVARNDEACIRYLLQRGADPNRGPPITAKGPSFKVRPVPYSPCTLNTAAACCTPEIFSLLLSHGADISKAIPLHCAAGHGQAPGYATSGGSRIPMLEYLVSLGIDVNSLDDAIMIAPDGRGSTGTPLQYAVLWGRIDEARWLLERGADPDKKTVFGISARDRVKRKPEHDPLSILFRTI